MVEMVMATGLPGYLLGCVAFAASLAAIMSTADSAILGTFVLSCLVVVL
jgi:hypothetical protein